MATSFPSSLDSLTNPLSTDPLSSPSHADQHANSNDAIEALEAKVGVNGSAVNTSLDYKVSQLETDAVSKTLVDAKGDLFVGTADDTVARLAVGTNGYGLVADSAETSGLKWAAVGDVTLTGTQTLTNKTLTSPVIENGELDQSSSGIPSKITALVEGVHLHGYTPGSFMDLMYNPSGGQGHVQYWANDTIFDFQIYCYAAYGFDTIMSVGQSLTMVAIVKNGATAYKPSSVTVTPPTGSIPSCLLGNR